MERYCRQFRGAKGAPRSYPAGLVAEVGLRWWRRECRFNPMEDLIDAAVLNKWTVVDMQRDWKRIFAFE